MARDDALTSLKELLVPLAGVQGPGHVGRWPVDKTVAHRLGRNLSAVCALNRTVMAAAVLDETWHLAYAGQRDAPRYG